MDVMAFPCIQKLIQNCNEQKKEMKENRYREN